MLSYFLNTLNLFHHHVIQNVKYTKTLLQELSVIEILALVWYAFQIQISFFSTQCEKIFSW